MAASQDYQMVLLLQDISQFLLRKFGFHCDIYEGFRTKRQAENGARRARREILTGDYAELVPIHNNMNDIDLYYLTKMSGGVVQRREQLHTGTVLVFIAVEEGILRMMPVTGVRRPLRRMHQPITLIDPQQVECNICFEEKGGEIYDCSRCHKIMCRECYYLFLANLLGREECCPFCRYNLLDHLKATFISPAQAAAMDTT